MVRLSRLFAALVALTCVTSAAVAQTTRPNVLFIAIDDLRPQLGCYGNAQMKTPHMDALAESGLRFNNAYCQQAVCSPSRISLLTGRRPDTTKIYDLNTHNRKTMPDVVTLPQHFKNNGYHSQGFGKVYHRGLDDEASWSVPHTDNRAMQYCEEQIIAKIKESGAQGWEQGGKVKGPAWEIAECEDNALPDGWITDRAIEALAKLGKDKPFFLAVGLEKPHLPFVAPKKYFDLYPPESITLPPDMKAPENVPPIALTNYAELRAYPGVPKGREPFDEAFAKDLIRGYYAATSYADAQVGRLLAELDALKLRDSTIVVLWGDHGYQLGEQNLWCKHTNFENSTRSALMIAAPGAGPKGKTDALVELVDVYLTLCALAKLSPPDGLEGTSFAPLMEDPKRPWKTAAFSQYPRQGDKVMGYSIRTERYRYTEWQSDWRTPDGAKVVARELYDHHSDPRETCNIADRAEHKKLVDDLSEQLKAGWRAAAPTP